MHATTSWWNNINWGTAPEWVSGLLTSVSVLLAVSILWRDRRRERRRFADSFVSWVDYTGNPKDAVLAEHWMYAVVHMFNSADVHVPVIVLRYRDSNGDTGAAAPLIRDDTGALSHPPRTEASVKVPRLPGRRY
ncbi:hypothetical protein ACFVUP_37950, partial [Streptomyces bacillaris]|uniref:hypothetical protein n=1 Tax=Streptomyces bacillaris TaxID=68179 RepID=UPI0036D7FF5F